VSDRDYTEQERLFLDACEDLSEADRDKIIRLAKRLARKPLGVHLKMEQCQNMFDTDTDIPLN
jgi:hypothetical protein